MLRKTSIILYAMMVIMILLLGFSIVNSQGADLSTCLNFNIGYGGWYYETFELDGDEGAADFGIDVYGSDIFGPINGALSNFFDNTAFEIVDYSMAKSLGLTDSTFYIPDVGDGNYPRTIVISSTSGKLFKVGSFYRTYLGSYYNVCFSYEELVAELVAVPFGEASYIKVPAGQKTLCVDRATKIVYDCNNLSTPLDEYPITDLTIKIVVGSDILELPLKKVKDETLIEAGTNSCYPWCYNGRYYVLCY